MRKQVLFLLLITFLNINAQEKRVYMYGELHDKVSKIINAHIININTKKGTFTNKNGEFRILAKATDSLLISFLGYNTKKIIVKNKHFGLHTNKISLIKTPIELDEVALRKNNLLGYLDVDVDVRDLKSERKIDAKTLNLPYAGSRILTPAERKIYTATSGIIDPLINWISGRTKKLKFLKFLEDKETRVQKIALNYSFYIEHKLKILPQDISRFIYFCEGDKDFKSLLFKDRLSMIHFLNKKATLFKKLNSKQYK